jgi:predicted O-methyltransferase YrrM
MTTATPEIKPASTLPPGVTEMVPFYKSTYRTALYDGTTPGLVVPLDHKDVIPEVKDRRPYAAVDEYLSRDLPTFTQRLKDLSAFFDPATVADEPKDEASPHWINNYLTKPDANLIYSMTRLLKPRRIVEIGSGNSTKFFRQAIRDGGLSTKITCIDPAPREEIGKVADEIILKSVVTMDETYFDALEPGDFLFNDGSHLVMHGSDLPYTVLRIMPRLKPGVFVHFHDIHLPLEYPPFADPLYWGEQYMIGALVMHNSAWKSWFPGAFMFSKGLIGAAGSYWLQRVHGDERAAAPTVQGIPAGKASFLSRLLGR